MFEHTKYLVRLVQDDTYEIMSGPSIIIHETSLKAAMERATRELSYAAAKYDSAELLDGDDESFITRITR